MKDFQPFTAARLALFLVVGVLALSVAWPRAGVAQDKSPDPSKDQHAVKDLSAQIRDLQSKVAKLEVALKQGNQGKPSAAPGMAGMGGAAMGMMNDKKMAKGTMGMGNMEGMDSDEMMKMSGGMGGGQQGMSGGGMAMMDKDEMMGMMGMGSMSQGGMKGMSKMKMAAALPGFPGASHIYHIGATGFFLDHPEHVALTTKQQTTLNSLKEKALLEKSSNQRKIDETEQELWTLTASDQPDAAKIDAKVREIEKQRGDQRLAFIRAVGEAAKVLTDEQRKALLGTATDKPGMPAGH